MKCLVTGGAGFIGSHVADALLAEGHTVHIVDDLSSGLKENVPLAATFHLLDLQDAALATLITRENFEVIFHLAAQIDVRKSVTDPAYDAQVNILGSLQLLEAAVQGGVKKVIFSSSGGAGYGEQDYFPADEQHPLRPLSPYGIAKVSVEHYLYYYQQVKGLPYVSLRYSNVYGPRQNPHGEAGVIAIFAEKILNGQQAYIFGDGRQTRDFVYVADVVSANLKALAYSASGCFNIGTGVETSVNELAQAVLSGLGGKQPPLHAPGKAGEQRRNSLNYALAAKLLHWQPLYTFNQGLQQTLAWFSQHHATTPHATTTS